MAEKHLLEALNTEDKSYGILEYEKKICKDLFDEINKNNEWQKDKINKNVLVEKNIWKYL